MPTPAARSPRARTSRVALAALIALACTVPAAFVHAQATNIPVLVLAEDEDGTTVKRSSDIFKRVLAELRGSMQRHGFRMIDEESVFGDLGWPIVDRRSKMELIEMVKLMNKSDDASHRVRAVVLVRVHAQAKKLSYAVKVQTRIAGEIYDVASNTFLDAFEMPRDEFPAPADCLESEQCIIEVVGDRAREIAAGLGEVLAVKLERYAPPRTDGGDVPVTGDGSARGSVFGLPTPYTLELRYFEDREALTIIGVMAEEFPGYRSHELLDKSAAVRRYQYLTTAKAYKLEEWLHILLRDMGFDVDKELLVKVQGTDLTVDKLIPTPNRPESADERQRFN